MKVKDFVELVVGKIPYMPIVDNSAKYADLTKKEDLVDKFGKYEVIKVEFKHDDMSYIVLHISNKDICFVNQPCLNTITIFYISTCTL